MGTIRDKGQVIRDAATARVFAQQKVRIMTLLVYTCTYTQCVHYIVLIRHHHNVTFILC